MTESFSHIALLAPVHAHHLESAAKLSSGRAAFGSDSSLVLSELALAAQEAACLVLFYPSHGAAGPPQVTWKARFVRYVGAKGGKHPDGDAYRPESTRDDGAWTGFYEVTGLEKLDRPRLISSLTTASVMDTKKGKKLSPTFVPHGPILIENPL